MIRTLIIRLTNIIRQPYWRFKRCKVFLRTHIAKGAFLRDTEVEEYTYLGRNCIINSAYIGRYASIASNVQIGGMEHAYWDLSTSCYLTDQNIEGHKTRIEHDAWIAADCIIKQGITIGAGAVVGANSFVNKDVPPYAIVVGSPARIIKYRFDEETIQRLQQSRYWLAPPPEARRILDTLRNEKKEKL